MYHQCTTTPGGTVVYDGRTEQIVTVLLDLAPGQDTELLSASVIVTDPAERREKCAWCWNERHPNGEPYPEHWSSTMCPPCEVRMHAQLAQRRAVKEAQRC